MLYTDKVMDHFNNPRNVGVIDDADGTGEVGNPVCGDVMKITIKVDDTDHITDLKFQTLGCGAAIATSSIVTELAKGMTIQDAAKISKKQVAEELGGLPPAKMHCSVLATDGLNALFANDNPALRLIRDIGLGLVDRLPGLKRMFIGEASGDGRSAPRLLRGEAI